MQFFKIIQRIEKFMNLWKIEIVQNAYDVQRILNNSITIV